MLLALEAGDITCRDWKAGITECNPYSMKFLRMDKDSPKKKYIRNNPITQRIVPVIRHINIKGRVTLNSLINKYINREERLYYSHEILQDKEKPIKLFMASGVKDTEEKEKEKKENKRIIVKILEKEKINILEKKEKIAIKETRELEKPIDIASIKSIKSTSPTPIISNKQEDNISQSKPTNELQKEIELEPKIKPIIKLTEKSQEKIKQEIKEVPKKEFAKYIVSKGDSLIAIARKFNVDTNSISKTNLLNENKVIHIGQELFIPMSQDRVNIINEAKYTVSKGDSITSIARKFNLEVKLLKKYNKLNRKSMIRIGQKLILPLPHKIAELNRIEEKAKQARLKKKRNRERLARIALKKKKAKKKKFLKATGKKLKRKLRVQATAYTSHRGQTDRTPFLAAWNNRLRPGMKIIAVSRDLIYSYGITNGSKVRISGLRGVYTVRDKMNKKWRKKIDIYMGTDRRRALRWGRRRVVLYY